eukprot:g7810.t1
MKSTRSSFPRLSTYFSQRSSIEGISNPSIFSPTSIAEPSLRFPATLSKDSLLSAPVSDILETKLSELAPSSRKHTFLRDIGYIGCTAENIAYLCKKDSPVLLPFEIRTRHDILFVATVQFEYNKKSEEFDFDVFLVIVTKKEINFYEARPIEQDEVDFLSSFSVACPMDCTLTSVQTVCAAEKHVCFGSDKGYVFELRLEGRNGAPVLICLNEDLSVASESPVRSMHQDDAKGLLYALHENSTINVFHCRTTTTGVSEAARRIASYTPPQQRRSFLELFPMMNSDTYKAHVLAVSVDGLLFNFEIDLRPTKGTIQFLTKLMTPHSNPNNLRLIREESCLASALQSDGTNRKLIGVGYLGGLVLAVPISMDGHHSVELWTASRLPTKRDMECAALIKEPVQLDGSVISIQPASDDDNSKLFDELDIGADEMSQQIFQKGKKFTVLAGSKVIDIRKRCPVESLLEILNVKSPERLDEFFELYGEMETATMAVQLAASRGEESAFQLLLDDSRLSTMLFASEGPRSSTSIPTKAIITYFRRLMNPLWNKSLVKVRKDVSWKKDEIKLTGMVSMALLEWFESSLLEFDTFLGRYIDEHQGIKFHDGTVVAPKCPAVLSEFETLFELKGLVNKCKEMIQLVQIFEENKPVVLEPLFLKTFEQTSFSTLAMMQESSDSPLREFMKSISAEKESEIQEAIIFRMDNELPVLSNRKEKIIAKALNLLMKAKSSPRPERQEKMIQKAMSLLDDQCDEIHIDKIVENLTELQRHYEVLQFVSKTAKKLVPELPTHDPEVQKKASVLRQRCYGRAFNYVDNYIKNIETDDASTDIPVLFGAVQCLSDPHMTRMMMEKLLASNKVPTSVLHQLSYREFGTALRKHLTKKLMDISKAMESGNKEELPISNSGVQEMRLLVEICQSHGDFKMAGDWLMIIAKRIPEKGHRVALIERIGDLNDARAMYDATMPDSFLKSIEKEIEIGMFQHRVLTVGRRIFTIMEDQHENEEDVTNVLTKLATPELLSRVIRERFPPQIGQDLSEELRRIVGDNNNNYDSDSIAAAEAAGVASV